MASRKLGDDPQRDGESSRLGVCVERGRLNHRVALNGVLKSQAEEGHAKSQT